MPSHSQNRKIIGQLNPSFFTCATGVATALGNIIAPEGPDSYIDCDFLFVTRFKPDRTHTQ